MTPEYEISWHGGMWRSFVETRKAPVIRKETAFGRTRKICENQELLMDALRTGPADLRQLSRVLGKSRHSVLRAIRPLIDERLVKILKPASSNRGAIYGWVD